MIDIQLSQAQAVREKLLAYHPQVKAPLDSLLRFMENFSYIRSNKLYRPGIEIDKKAIGEQLEWFATREADDILKSVAHG